MHTRRTDEEKIKMIEEYDKTCSSIERDKLAKKYGYKNRKNLRRVIYSFKIKFCIHNINEKPSQKLYDLPDKDKLKLIETWSDLNKEKKEELAKKYNLTYRELAPIISTFRKTFNINIINPTHRTDEEKIKMLREYNNAKNKEEREELAKKYGLKYSSIGSAIAHYRKELNIDEYVGIKSDEYKLGVIRDFENANSIADHELLAEKYGHSNANGIRQAVSRYRRQLRKG